jgi:hypothetical protein
MTTQLQIPEVPPAPTFRTEIDLVDGNGTAVVSAAHSHGPACSGVHKIVDFVLAPGTYILQISGNADRAGKVLVVRLPG